MLRIRRYPESSNRSLRPNSAADDLMLEFINEQQIDCRRAYLLNDRFGFLACNLEKFSPVSIIHYKSQEKALRQNMINNELPIIEQNILIPFDKWDEQINTVLMKVPKSLDLFRFQLFQVSQNISENGLVLCGFMTRHFTKQMLEIASEYFEELEQSLAKKKARLLILKKKKNDSELSPINEINYNDSTFKQYFGVFSSEHIDYATQFFLDHLKLTGKEECILDLACGNGIIGSITRKQNPKAEIHFLDDFFLAVESSKLNEKSENSHFHFSDNLENFPSEFFDLVVSNPPYHFEHETNIEVALDLFKQVQKRLKPKGKFQLVSAVSINFKSHLDKLFTKVSVLAINEKFVIYDCLK